MIGWFQIPNTALAVLIFQLFTVWNPLLQKSSLLKVLGVKNSSPPDIETWNMILSQHFTQFSIPIMFYDLNIPCVAQPDRAAIDKLKLILSQASQSQACTVALNFTMSGSNPKKMSSISDKYNFDLALLNSKFPLTILHRVTIDTNDSVSNDTLKLLRDTFDLIAIRTSNLEVLKEACSTYNIDIISPNCSERLSFEFNPLDLSTAMERDIYFELCYANAIRDLQARTYTTQVAKQLFQYTQGNKCIISSEAENVSEIRAPGDIFYFAKSLGLANDKAKFTVEKNCEQAIHLAQNKKQ